MSGVSRVLAVVGAVVLVGAAAYGAIRFWQERSAYVTTRNAYVHGEITTIAPRVSGYVVELYVSENEVVSPAQPLLLIDQRDSRAQLRKAEASLEERVADMEDLDAQRAEQEATIAANEAALNARRAEADFTGREAARAIELFETGAGTRQDMEDMVSQDRSARAQVAEAEADLNNSKVQRATLDAQELTIIAERESNRADYESALLDLEDRLLWSPGEGTIARRNVEIGEYLTAGDEALTLVPSNIKWVEANLRETVLPRIRRGDRVELSVDGLGGAVICGTIQSVSPAAGTEFALIPPDNATGNFTKIVRRFPVRIALDSDDPLFANVRPGMSVIPRIAIGSYEDGRVHSDGFSLPGVRPFGCETDGPTPPPELYPRTLPEEKEREIVAFD